MFKQYLYYFRVSDNFWIIIVYKTFNMCCLYSSIQNSSHFSMLGLGDIVSNTRIFMYMGGKLFNHIIHKLRWFELIHTEKLQIYLCKGSPITKFALYEIYILYSKHNRFVTEIWYCLELYTFDLKHWSSVCLQVMPGLLLCFVLRYDAYKKTQTNSVEAGVPPPPTYVHRVTYFHCSLIGYFLGKIHVLVPTWTVCTLYQVLFGPCKSWLWFD